MTPKEKDEVQIAVMASNIQTIKEEVRDINGKLERNYVTIDMLNLRLQPLEQAKNIVFAFIGLILIAFAGAIITFFITK